MKKQKKLSLGTIKVQSFVTSFSWELSKDEQKRVYGGTDRVWMCPPNYLTTLTTDSYSKTKECLLLG